jgi:hypothetical protein
MSHIGRISLPIDLRLRAIFKPAIAWWLNRRLPTLQSKPAMKLRYGMERTAQPMPRPYSVF